MFESTLELSFWCSRSGRARPWTSTLIGSLCNRRAARNCGIRGWCASINGNWHILSDFWWVSKLERVASMFHELLSCARSCENFTPHWCCLQVASRLVRSLHSYGNWLMAFHPCLGSYLGLASRGNFSSSQLVASSVYWDVVNVPEVTLFATIPSTECAT